MDLLRAHKILVVLTIFLGFALVAWGVLHGVYRHESDAYGMLVLGTVAFAQYRGWSMESMNQLKNVPKSVRDNPGSYRSVYSGYHHYTGGK